MKPPDLPAGYAVCDECGQVMEPGVSCRSNRAYPWGEEPGLAETPVTWNCHDCFTAPGGRHHGGCTVSVCALGCRNPANLEIPDQAAFCRHRGQYSAAVH
jgi:hypothetical protein